MRLPRPPGHAVRRLAEIAGLVAVFTMTSVQVASAADGSSGSGVLGPLEALTTPDGVPLAHYELVTDPGNSTDIQSQLQTYMMSALWSVVRTVVGLACWLIRWAYQFPVLHAAIAPAQRVADTYRVHVVDALGLPGLLLAWAVVVCSVMIMRGRAGRGLGELVLTFVIVAVASSAVIRPDVVLGSDGLVEQTHQAALEVGALTASGGQAPANARAADAASPSQTALTGVFIDQSYQLLEFGRLIPKGDKAYGAYIKAMRDGPFSTDSQASTNQSWNILCKIEPTQKMNQYCNELSDPTIIGNRSYKALSDRFKNVDPGIAAYVLTPSWDRVLGVVLVLIASVVVLVLALAMVLALLGAQCADAVLASCGYPALIWATLPGPSRGVLWRWMGNFFSSLLVLLIGATFLPAFGLTAGALLGSESSGALLARIALVDLLAVAALGWHRQLLRGASTMGARFAQRMRWARVGGSYSFGGDSRLGQVMSAALSERGGPPRSGGVLPFGQAAAGGMAGMGALGMDRSMHRALARRAVMVSAMGAMNDATGMPLHPGGLLASAGAEAQRAAAPLTLLAMGARQAWVGPPKTPLEIARKLKTPGRGGELPIGARLHNRLMYTRGGRALVLGSKIAWGATIGAPATWTRTKRQVTHRARHFKQEAEAQATHYRYEAKNYWKGDWAKGAREMTKPVRAAGRGAAQAGRTARDHVNNARDVWFPAQPPASPKPGTHGRGATPPPPGSGPHPGTNPTHWSDPDVDDGSGP